MSTLDPAGNLPIVVRLAHQRLDLLYIIVNDFVAVSARVITKLRCRQFSTVTFG